MRPLEGKIALVAGATRGAGRGIACMLGAAGATVYCTGRSTRDVPRAPGGKGSPFVLASRPETIEETAERVDAHGGRGIAVRVDHTDPEQVRFLVDRIAADAGRLDVLVNDVWGGDELAAWGRPFWEQAVADGVGMVERGVLTHLITAHAAAPLLIRGHNPLLVEITDGHGFFYRGNLFYDLVKTSLIRLAFGLARELGPRGVTALALTPGFLRSEAMLEHFGVTEANWREGAEKDPAFIASETPFYVGRAVAALAADPGVSRRAGRVYSSWELALAYGFTDVDGRRPDFEAYLAEHRPDVFFRRADDAFYAYWG